MRGGRTPLGPLVALPQRGRTPRAGQGGTPAPPRSVGAIPAREQQVTAWETRTPLLGAWSQRV